MARFTNSADQTVQNAIDDLVNGAPAALDTLNEIAAAMGDDENFATTVLNSLDTKSSKSLVVEEATNKILSADDLDKLFVNTTTTDKTLTIPVDDGTVFANGFRTKLLQTDSGKIVVQPGSATEDTWSTTSVQNVTSMVGLAANSTTLIAADASGNIYRSTDNGTTSTLVATVANNFSGVGNAVFNSAGSDVFVITTRYTLYISTDDGLTFSPTTNQPTGYQGATAEFQETVCSTDGQFFLVSSNPAQYEGKAIFVSSDFGATWTYANPYGANVKIAGLAYSDYFNCFYVTNRHNFSLEAQNFRIRVHDFSGGTVPTTPTTYFGKELMNNIILNYGYYEMFADGPLLALAAMDGIYAVNNGSNVSASNPFVKVHSWNYTSSSPSDITEISKSGNSYYAFRKQERNASVSTDGINWTDIPVSDLNYSTSASDLMATGTGDTIFLYDGTDLYKAGLVSVILNGTTNSKETSVQHEIVDLIKTSADSWHISGLPQ